MTLGLPECSADGTVDGKLESLLLGALLGSVDGLKLGANEWTGVAFWDGRVFGTTLGAFNHGRCQAVCTNSAWTWLVGYTGYIGGYRAWIYRMFC